MSFKTCNKEILKLFLGDLFCITYKIDSYFSRGNLLCLPTKCNGYIDCSWLTPNDEANCFGCQSSYLPNRCDCNKPEAMNCTGVGFVCYKGKWRGKRKRNSG